MNDDQSLRVYDPDVDDFAVTGYPLAWEWVKHHVRTVAGHRCERCRHPYVVGQSGTMDPPSPELQAMMEEHEIPQMALDLAMELVAEDEGSLTDPTLLRMAKRQHWSPCDQQCKHVGPLRFRSGDGPWKHLDIDVEPEMCGVGWSEADECQAAWRILTVHHLNGIKGDCRWWNLVALCQRCHLTIQGKVVMGRVWPWEHTEWFQPYAAAWYALAYLGEELSREETVSRLDELLALERMA